jgi:HK97 family phage portal protein
MPFPDWLTKLFTAGAAADADRMPHQRHYGVGQEWRPREYLNYYPTSENIFAAVNIRANALGRAHFIANTMGENGRPVPLSSTHPAQRLLNKPNPWMTSVFMKRLMEIHLCMQGAAYWNIEISDAGEFELWPIPRPDRMRELPGEGSEYVKGYVYEGAHRDRAFLPEEIVAFKYPNPIEQRAGQAPIAPLRLTDDMGQAARKYNRQVFANGGVPDFVIFADEQVSDQQAKDFYARWDERYGGQNNAHRPAIMGGGRDIKPLAFNQREAEFIEGLQWTVEATARVMQVPQPMLGSLREATLANVEALERIFWRQTMQPECHFIAAHLQEDLMPRIAQDGVIVTCDFGDIDVLQESEDLRVQRETAHLNANVVTINEVRASRNMPPVPWGDEPLRRPGDNDQRDEPPRSRSEGQSGLLEYGAHTEAHPSNGRIPSQARQ